MKSSSNMACPGCYMPMGQCKCGSKWCYILVGVLVLALGLLMLYPVGWFTFEHTVGLLVVLLGAKKIWKSFSGGCCH